MRYRRRNEAVVAVHDGPKPYEDPTWDSDMDSNALISTCLCNIYGKRSGHFIMLCDVSVFPPTNSERTKTQVGKLRQLGV